MKEITLLAFYKRQYVPLRFLLCSYKKGLGRQYDSFFVLIETRPKYVACSPIARSYIFFHQLLQAVLY